MGLTVVSPPASTVATAFEATRGLVWWMVQSGWRKSACRNRFWSGVHVGCQHGRGLLRSARPSIRCQVLAGRLQSGRNAGVYRRLRQRNSDLEPGEWAPVRDFRFRRIRSHRRSVSAETASLLFSPRSAERRGSGGLAMENWPAPFCIKQGLFSRPSSALTVKGLSQGASRVSSRFGIGGTGSP